MNKPNTAGRTAKDRATLASRTNPLAVPRSPLVAAALTLTMTMTTANAQDKTTPTKAPNTEQDAALGQDATQAAAPDLEGRVERTILLRPPAADTDPATAPAILLRAPPRAARNGAAILVVPGGGYGHLAMGHEGEDVARYLNDHGVVAAFLRYRIAPAVTPLRAAPWEDATRGMRLLRSLADELGVHEDRVGVLGFSAGGHLAATLSVRNDGGDPDADDLAERRSSHPSFSILVYPVIDMIGEWTHKGSRRNLLGDESEDDERRAWSPHLHVDARTPPALLVHSADDPVRIENSLLYRDALTDAGVAVEMMRFDHGGHGYGLAPGREELGTWPGHALDWMRTGGWLVPKE